MIQRYSNVTYITRLIGVWPCSCVCKIRLAVLALQNASFDCGNSSKGIIYLLTKRKVRKCVLNVLIVAFQMQITLHVYHFENVEWYTAKINSLVHAFCIMFVLNG